ncbi:MAG: hypothetical protein ACP5OP_07815 [Leptospirillia bacterium]
MTRSEQATGLLLLLASGAPPILFPISQAGYASMADLGIRVLIPAVLLFFLLVFWAYLRGMKPLLNRVQAGAAAGLLATGGLEVVRGVSFHFGGMPGNLPQLLGVLLTGRIMEGPDLMTDLAGWGYHFWNGLCFGIIYTLVLGRKKAWIGVLYGVVIGLIFLASPAVSGLGIGFMGVDMPSMPVTVVLAHLVFGSILGILSRRWLWEGQGILSFSSIFPLDSHTRSVR